MNDTQLTETFLSSEVVFPGKIIRLEHWQVQLPNGKQALREVACHPGASAVVAIDDDGQIILVRQHRIAVGRLTLEIPAGKLESIDEPTFDCAVRELEEETGLRAENMTFLTDVATTPGFCTEHIGLYLATGLSQHEDHPDADEFLHVVKMPLAEAVSKVMAGELRDAKTALGLLMAWHKLGGLPVK